jgi:hypothetical protein
MMANADSSLTLAMSAARKLFRRYSEASNGAIFEPMLERCLNVALKMDMSVNE